MELGLCPKLVWTDSFQAYAHPTHFAHEASCSTQGRKGKRKQDKKSGTVRWVLRHRHFGRQTFCMAILLRPIRANSLLHEFGTTMLDPVGGPDRNSSSKASISITRSPLLPLTLASFTGGGPPPGLAPSPFFNPRAHWNLGLDICLA